MDYVGPRHRGYDKQIFGQDDAKDTAIRDRRQDWSATTKKMTRKGQQEHIQHRDVGHEDGVGFLIFSSFFCFFFHLCMMFGCSSVGISLVVVINEYKSQYGVRHRAKIYNMQDIICSWMMI